MDSLLLTYPSGVRHVRLWLRPVVVVAAVAAAAAAVSDVRNDVICRTASSSMQSPAASRILVYSAFTSCRPAACRVPWLFCMTSRWRTQNYFAFVLRLHVHVLIVGPLLVFCFYCNLSPFYSCRILTISPLFWRRSRLRFKEFETPPTQRVCVISSRKFESGDRLLQLMLYASMILQKLSETFYLIESCLKSENPGLFLHLTLSNLNRFLKFFYF